MRALRWSALLSLLSVVLPATASAQWYYWYPTAPAVPPYHPPVNYGPGNHHPYPFQQYYPNHPYAPYYWPYTYLPYSGYYSYPTPNVYGDSWNPYYPRPMAKGYAPMPGQQVVPGAEPLPNPPTVVPAVVR